MNETMQTPGQVPEEEAASLLDYLLPLVRWRWLIFLLTACAGAAGVLYARWQKPYYVATAYFVPAGALNKAAELEGIVGEMGPDWGRVQSASDMARYFSVALRTRTLLLKVLERPFAAAGRDPAPLADLLEPGSHSLPEERRFDRAVGRLRKAIEVKSSAGKLLQVSVTGPDAALAAGTVNALIEEYEKLPRKAERVSADITFIREQLDEVRGKLEAKEREIAEAKARSLDRNEPDALRRMAALEREARLLEKLFESLNTEYAHAGIRRVQAQKAAMREIDLLEPPEAPSRPAGPNRRKTVLVFLLAGAACGAGIAFAAEHFRSARRLFSSHPFWRSFDRARRDLVLMAIGVCAAAAAWYLLR